MFRLYLSHWRDLLSSWREIPHLMTGSGQVTLTDDLSDRKPIAGRVGGHAVAVCEPLSSRTAGPRIPRPDRQV